MVPENIHTHPKDVHWKIRGGGGLKSRLKLFKVKYEAKLEIPGGGGVEERNRRTILGGGMDIFCNHTF